MASRWAPWAKIINFIIINAHNQNVMTIIRIITSEKVIKKIIEIHSNTVLMKFISINKHYYYPFLRFQELNYFFLWNFPFLNWRILWIFGKLLCQSLLVVIPIFLGIIILNFSYNSFNLPNLNEILRALILLSWI